MKGNIPLFELPTDEDIWLAVTVTSIREIPVDAPDEVSALTRAARRDLYGDAVNEAVFMRPGQHATRALVEVDDRAVDGAVGGVAALIGAASARLRTLQSGFARSYALSMLVGAALVVATMVLW